MVGHIRTHGPYDAKIVGMFGYMETDHLRAILIGRVFKVNGDLYAARFYARCLNGFHQVGFSHAIW